MKKIIIAGFQHETNTFAPTKASYVDFVQGGGFPPLSRGADVLKFWEQNIPIGGFIQQAEQFGYQLLPVIWAGTSPSAHVEQETLTSRSVMKLLQASSSIRQMRCIWICMAPWSVNRWMMAKANC